MLLKNPAFISRAMSKGVLSYTVVGHRPAPALGVRLPENAPYIYILRKKTNREYRKTLFGGTGNKLESS